ncbi:hypothetical protein ACFYM2_00890 [Streptomyces sp. NPDC006711]|uniref:hypothetical protein n=1 Tax=unclassified Streptomyces TaxID=2593676 RepID=UPI0036AFFD4D
MHDAELAIHAAVNVACPCGTGHATHDVDALGRPLCPRRGGRFQAAVRELPG